MIKRLRPAHSVDELKEIYAQPHEHHYWQDHIIRVQKTIELLRELPPIKSAADLSAGDATIINSLDCTKFIGDFAPKYEYCGAIEETIEQIPKVDLYICSETLEHLDNPLAVLKKIRSKTKYLILSTPHAKWEDVNLEHYWAWDTAGIEYLLKQSCFETISCQMLYLEKDYYYDYQIWLCK